MIAVVKLRSKRDPAVGTFVLSAVDVLPVRAIVCRPAPIDALYEKPRVNESLVPTDGQSCSEYVVDPAPNPACPFPHVPDPSAACGKSTKRLALKLFRTPPLSKPVSVVATVPTSEDIVAYANPKRPKFWLFGPMPHGKSVT